MATKKEKEAATVDEPKFTKKQFVKDSRKCARYRDYLNAQLKDGAKYTKAEVESMIEKAFKVKIKI